jgi:pyruvate dehydrogenase E2 component (dihydrolipoamide acetyltransferase)
MSTDMVMPFLSESMESGTVVSWLKQVGDDVLVGDDLVEIETDKAFITYQSDTAGVLLEILVDPDETVPTGHVIARIGSVNN